MKIAFSLLLACCTLLACQQKAAEKTNYSYLDEEIADLDENELRRYWKIILSDDQKYRKEESAIVQQYGHDSEQHKAIWEKIKEVDDLNLAKVEKLMAKYGYPGRFLMDGSSSEIPWLVVHHHPSYEAKERAFPYLYEAYKSGDLREGDFSFYLNRMYEMKMGKRYEVGAVFREEDRINGIIGELGLMK